VKNFLSLWRGWGGELVTGTNDRVVSGRGRDNWVKREKGKWGHVVGVGGGRGGGGGGTQGKRSGLIKRRTQKKEEEDRQEWKQNRVEGVNRGSGELRCWVLGHPPGLA